MQRTQSHNLLRYVLAGRSSHERKRRAPPPTAKHSSGVGRVTCNCRARGWPLVAATHNCGSMPPGPKVLVV